ncbi:hypothetical protein [Rhodohalobacter mucosus]|uniref:Tetratricopeptide repeat protein n=1 Tax=Rhodohalobacter mucosus TaxID=2079485 RepID=A0A316TMV3_9BACT|nr:hypothetical protein [Rhodohalobacter mucosus]PWN05927.1 hypothetical protein DDZ15_12130 [Rhodohalobacter mucosus]
MPKYRLFLSIIVLSAVSSLFTGCNNESSEIVDENLPLPQKIDRLIEANEYETALSLLSNEDREDPDIRLLLEKTHLNYGLHSMNTFDQTEMRTRMNNALTQFTEVLKINPQNQVARDQIEQIMAIYSTIPNRQPEPEVLEGLREVGFDY